jgi:hypothetical protein
MKPSDWDDYTAGEKRNTATVLLNSVRGALIIGQALAHAVKAMRAVEPSYMREISNIEDMEMLGEALFEPWYSMTMNEDALREKAMSLLASLAPKETE